MPCAMRGAQAALSPIFGAPAMPVPWQAEQAVSKTDFPSVGIAAAAAGAPATATAVVLIASAALSSPATATWPNGLMRSCAEACMSGSSVSRAPFGPLSTMREMPTNMSAIAISTPRTALNTFLKWWSVFAIDEL